MVLSGCVRRGVTVRGGKTSSLSMLAEWWEKADQLCQLKGIDMSELVLLAEARAPGQSRPQAMILYIVKEMKRISRKWPNLDEAFEVIEAAKAGTIEETREELEAARAKHAELAMRPLSPQPVPLTDTGRGSAASSMSRANAGINRRSWASEGGAPA